MKTMEATRHNGADSMSNEAECIIGDILLPILEIQPEELGHAIRSQQEAHVARYFILPLTINGQ